LGGAGIKNALASSFIVVPWQGFGLVSLRQAAHLGGLLQLQGFHSISGDTHFSLAQRKRGRNGGGHLHQPPVSSTPSQGSGIQLIRALQCAQEEEDREEGRRHQNREPNEATSC